MFAFTVIIDELKTYLGFPDKGYEEVLLRGIGVLHPIVIYANGGKCFFLIYLFKLNVQQKRYICGRIDNHRVVFCLGWLHITLYT